MSPTLKTGDNVLLETSGYQIYRGDLIGIKFKNRKMPMIKRVVAITGDKIKLDDIGLRVNGTLYKVFRTGKPYPIHPKQARWLRLQIKRYGGIVPNGKLVLLGDNPYGSFDSSAYGMASLDQVIGKAVPVLNFSPNSNLEEDTQ